MSHTPKDGFPYYFDFVKDMDCRQLFISQARISFLEAIDEERVTYRYAPNKWSIKQIVGHITDHERIKLYRAFLLSRNESVQLWGYDQESLVANSCFEAVPWQLLLTDFSNVRKASISFVETLSENQFQIKGMAGPYEVTLEDFLKSIIGHEIHHINHIKEKYIHLNL